MPPNQRAGAWRQLAKNVLTERIFEINGQTSLIAIDRQEISADVIDERRAPLTAVVAGRRRFNLNDVSSHVGEKHRADRARQDPREINDNEIIQWFHKIVKRQPIKFLDSLRRVLEPWFISRNKMFLLQTTCV